MDTRMHFHKPINIYQLDSGHIFYLERQRKNRALEYISLVYIFLLSLYLQRVMGTVTTCPGSL